MRAEIARTGRRLATGEASVWQNGRERLRAVATFWVRFRDGRDADPLALFLLWDVMAPGWLACRVGTRHLTDGFCEEDMDIWDSHGRLVAQSRQLTLLQ